MVTHSAFQTNPEASGRLRQSPCFAVTGTPAEMAFKSWKKSVHCAVQPADQHEIFLLASKRLSSGPRYGFGSPQTLSWMLEETRNDEKSNLLSARALCAATAAAMPATRRQQSAC